MSYMKDVRSGSEGNKTLLKQYGGTSGCADRQGYATGGAVGGLNKDGPAMAEGLSAAGTPAKPSLARPGRKIGKKKDAKTNINVIVAGAPPKEAPMPMPPMGGPPPGPPIPPPGAGPGGPPMPMRASGGRVDAGATSDADTAIMGKSGRYKVGGKVKKRADGGSTLSADSKREVERLRGSADQSRSARNQAGALAAGSGILGSIGNRMQRSGFKPAALAMGALAGAGHLMAKKDDTEADRIERGQAEPGKEDRKHGGKVCRAEGGPVDGLSNDDGGAGGASGRLAKVKMYGK